VRCTENKNKNKYIKIQTLHLSTGNVRCTEKKLKNTSKYKLYTSAQAK
jgi:hypothetical protein